MSITERVGIYMIIIEIMPNMSISVYMLITNRVFMS